MYTYIYQSVILKIDKSLIFLQINEHVLFSLFDFFKFTIYKIINILKKSINFMLYLTHSEHLPEYYPKSQCKKKGFFSKEPGTEDRLADAHSRAFKKFGQAESESQCTAVYKKYLEFCWKLPYYG